MNRLGTWDFTLAQAKKIVARTVSFHRGSIERLEPGFMYRTDGRVTRRPVRVEVSCEELRPNVCRFTWTFLSRGEPCAVGALDAQFAPINVKRPRP